MGFSGNRGSSSSYVPPPPPPPPPPEKPQVAKPVSEAATSARQAQKDKASKAVGIRGSVFTDPLNDNIQGGSVKTLLGQ